jgi:hypothetical protein
LVALLAGCATATPAAQPSPPADASRPPVAAGRPTAEAAATPVEALVDEASAPAVDAAKEQFAADTGVPKDEITVVRVEPMTWSDSSLGCGKSGSSYLQVLTPGYRVTLEANGERRVYHTTDGQNGPVNVVQCQQPAAALGKMPNIDLGTLSAGSLDNARRDLATRLGTDEGIELVTSGVAKVTQLICDGTPVTPRPGAPAYVVFEFVLRQGEQQHLYRAAGDRVLYCGPVDPVQVDSQGNPTR